MRLAALFSGGKDSVLAIHLAEQMGHTVPYLLNVRPEGGSWIFHVPNQNMVPLMAVSMGKELRSVPTDGTEGGDMDALRTLLEDLDAEGVVTGAVWSDYQWERINAVCGEYGLKTISPLWRKDQRTVLKEVIDSGIKAIIAGAYAEGLTEEWLGRMIDKDSAEELAALSERYGISVIGEGGEYESLVIDSPIQSSAISLDAYEKEWKNGSGTLRVTAASLR